MTDELVARAKEILVSVEYLNVASVTAEGLPWNTPVYARHDHSLTFYWTSWVKAQHSVNLAQSGDAFVTLYDSTRKRGQNNRRCLYLQGVVAEVIDAEEIEPLLQLLYGEEANDMKIEDYAGNALKKIYKFIPSCVWLNDISERQVDDQTVKMRIEVPLNELRSALVREITDR